MKVAIFGAGIAGLTAAHELAERGFQVHVYEKDSTPGGKARSFMLSGNKNSSSSLLASEHGFRFFLRW
jgi:15-cis-phytoene desaturase